MTADRESRGEVIERENAAVGMDTGRLLRGGGPQSKRASKGKQKWENFD